MKVLSKKEIVAKKEVAHTIGERKILQRSLESPFLVGLKFSFQTDSDLYLVTDFKSGGELFWHLQRETRFSEERARFYIAELILALEHLHKYNIVYRFVTHSLLTSIFDEKYPLTQGSQTREYSIRRYRPRRPLRLWSL
jgi:serine/threonine protein kinase